MANERFGIMCPICKDAVFVGKHFNNGLYAPDDPAQRLAIMYDWMWKHLVECHGQVEWPANDATVVYQIVHEGHPSLKFDQDNHWNRHKGD